MATLNILTFDFKKSIFIFLICRLKIIDILSEFKKAIFWLWSYSVKLIVDISLEMMDMNRKIIENIFLVILIAIALVLLVMNNDNYLLFISIAVLYSIYLLYKRNLIKT